jgi:hypothetical protein
MVSNEGFLHCKTLQRCTHAVLVFNFLPEEKAGNIFSTAEVYITS